MKELKPIGGLTKTVVAMLCIYIFITACHILTSIYELIELSFYDRNVYLEELLPSQVSTALVGLVYLFIYLITAICFLKWTYRVSKNLHALAGGAWMCSAGGAVGWYFVPIATLYKPYQAMREIWTKAHKAWAPGTKLLPGWWTLWIVSTLLANVVMRQTAELVQEYQMAAITQLISDAVDIALGFTALALISNIARAYETNYGGTPNTAADRLEIPAAENSDYQKNLQTLENTSD